MALQTATNLHCLSFLNCMLVLLNSWESLFEHALHFESVICPQFQFYCGRKATTPSSPCVLGKQNIAEQKPCCCC